jgi:tetratricopeptide (TPR) repeat protein
MDSSFATAYNDAGVVYEAKGQIDRAEGAYLKAISIDPAYLSSYANLALLYEGKRDLAKAAEFWKKRAELGSLDDSWTNSARERGEELSLILSKTPLEDLKEKEILGLTKRMSKPRTLFTQDDASLGRMHFMKAHEFYNKRDFASAVKEASDAQQFDLANKEIEEFIEKVQLRALSE